MKRKQNQEYKLRLNTTTIRLLSADQVNLVTGGILTWTDCPSELTCKSRCDTADACP